MQESKVTCYYYFSDKVFLTISIVGAANQRSSHEVFT
jgi:hypothetical protein